MFVFQLVFIFYVGKAVAIPPDCEFTVDDDEVAVDCSTIDVLLDDRFFEVLKHFESRGDLCNVSKVNDTYKIGPYQISENYYNEATCFNESLKMNG